MIYRTPGYCRNFHCIAGECRDSCCKGWEIDIDEEAAARYTAAGGEFGERLRSNIKNGSFVLTEDERCPFLNDEGLCDIYINLGRESLCHICSEHPRYFEWFGSVKEGGTGLCCEASAKLILSQPFTLCEEKVLDEEAAGEYDGELFSLLLEARAAMLDTVANEELPIGRALAQVLDIAEEAQQYIDIPDAPHGACTDISEAVKEIFRCFSELEHIDSEWLPYIESCEDKLPSAPPHSEEHTHYLRRIAAYFIFRYVMKSVYDGNVLGYAAFAAVSTIFISWLYRCGSSEEKPCGFEKCAVIAKNYSKETEYCEENMEKLLGLSETGTVFDISTLKLLIADSFGENVDNI